LEAVGAFVDAIAADRMWTDAYVGIGRALIALRDAEKALAAYNTAIDLDATLLVARSGRASVYEMLNRRDAAVSEWHVVIQLDPENVKAHRRLAILYYYDHDYVNAWKHTYRTEAIGGSVPSHFRVLLDKRLPERSFNARRLFSEGAE
jgi:tetratricopeptide (TPR) repeat protein